MESNFEIEDAFSDTREVSVAQEVKNYADRMENTLTKGSGIGTKISAVEMSAQSKVSAYTTIKSLAEELIDKIMINLRDEEDTKALTSLSLVSKKFHRIVEPHLYHHITVVLHSSIFSGVAGNAKELIRTFFYHVHFRQGVRMLTVVRNEADNWIGDSTRNHDYRAYNRLSLGNDKHCDNYLVALIHYLPYIETLDLSQYLWTDQARIPIFSAYSNWSQNLKKVDISICGEFSILALHSMFMLPSIESIAVRGGRIPIDATEENLRPWTNSYSKSTVKHLMLKDLLHEVGELDIIASLCTVLSSLGLYSSDFESRFSNQALDYEKLRCFKNQMTSTSMQQLAIVDSVYGVGFRISVKNIPATLYSSWALENERQWDHLFFEPNETRDNIHLIDFLRTLDLFGLVAADNLARDGRFPNDDLLTMLVQRGLRECVEAIGFYPVPVSLTFMTKYRLDKEKIAKLKVSDEKNLQLHYVPASRD